MWYCRRCKEYKGIVICTRCKKEYCEFCQGDGTNICPECVDEKDEQNGEAGQG